MKGKEDRIHYLKEIGKKRHIEQIIDMGDDKDATGRNICTKNEDVVSAR